MNELQRAIDQLAIQVSNQRMLQQIDRLQRLHLVNRILEEAMGTTPNVQNIIEYTSKLKRELLHE